MAAFDLGLPQETAPQLKDGVKGIEIFSLAMFHFRHEVLIHLAQTLNDLRSGAIQLARASRENNLSCE
jgi:hypothetical protein